MGVDAGTIYSEVRIALDKLTGDIREVQAKFDQMGKTDQQQADQIGKGWLRSLKLTPRMAGLRISTIVFKESVKAAAKYYELPTADALLSRFFATVRGIKNG